MSQHVGIKAQRSTMYACESITHFKHEGARRFLNMNHVVARRALALPDEATSQSLGDCFGKEQERLAATCFFHPSSFVLYSCKRLFDLRLQYIEELGQAIPFIERHKGTQI